MSACVNESEYAPVCMLLTCRPVSRRMYDCYMWASDIIDFYYNYKVKLSKTDNKLFKYCTDDRAAID